MRNFYALVFFGVFGLFTTSSANAQYDWDCECNLGFNPVCVTLETGEQVTMLNSCIAECLGFSEYTEGVCEGDDDWNPSGDLGCNWEWDYSDSTGWNWDWEDDWEWDWDWNWDWNWNIDSIDWDLPDTLIIDWEPDTIIFDWEPDTTIWDWLPNDTIVIDWTPDTTGWDWGWGIDGGDIEEIVDPIVQQSFDSFQEKEFNIDVVYPNPTMDFTRVAMYASEEAIFRFAIYDMQGSLVRLEQATVSRGYSSQLIDLTELESGVYLLSISAPDIDKTIQLIKQQNFIPQCK